MENSRFFSASELMQRWRINEYDLLSLIISKYIPYYPETPLLGQFPGPEAGLLEQLSPTHTDNSDLESINSKYFYKIDILRFEIDNPGLELSPKQRSNKHFAGSSKSKSENGQELFQIENFFNFQGHFWEVGFAGETATLKDIKGLQYVVALLRNPGHEFYPQDLRNLIEGTDNNLSDDDQTVRHHYSNMSKINFEEGTSRLESEEGLYTDLQNMPTRNLSDREKKLTEKFIYNIWEPGIDERNEEWKKLLENLKNKYGIFVINNEKGPMFKYRSRMNEDNDKARKLISNNINNFKKELGRMPLFKDHLDKYIKTGYKFFYSPDENNSVEWQIKD